ncbi:MAG: hypothetical protein KatS3mg111_2845 [Pirellulaceae bacterium]|nr:MAG: hypothetical protein KatS3mg111_2845 [Pirellulaceae bacterium]
MFRRVCWYTVWVLVGAISPGVAASAADGFRTGKPDLQQAGVLAFAPDGILLVGDTVGAAVFAIDTEDRGPEHQGAPVHIEGINKRIAALTGSTPDDVLINDLAVNPASGKVYLSASIGRGPDAAAAIFCVDHSGQLSEFSLDQVRYAKSVFQDAPEFIAGRRNPRLSAITDIQFLDGKVIVAGLSNEEFASKLRVLDYPFNGQQVATSIEVFHGAHGRLETHSPVRTFITYDNAVLAAYTCTPLVTIPLEDLQGDKVRGKTVAELGNRNHPLDMIVYRKGDQDYLLLANSARGVMKLKLSAAELNAVPPITEHIPGGGTAGLPFEQLNELENVVQLDKLDAAHAVLLVDVGDALDLRTIPLP